MNQNELIALWEKCLFEIEKEVSKPNFATWFKNTYIVREESGSIIVGVPNEFVKDWLNNKYQKLILKSLMVYYENTRSVEFVIAKSQDRPKLTQETQKPVDENKTIQSSLPLEQNTTNKDDNLNPRYTFSNFIIGPFNELAHAASIAVVN